MAESVCDSESVHFPTFLGTESFPELLEQRAGHLCLLLPCLPQAWRRSWLCSPSWTREQEAPTTRSISPGSGGSRVPLRSGCQTQGPRLPGSQLPHFQDSFPPLNFHALGPVKCYELDKQELNYGATFLIPSRWVIGFSPSTVNPTSMITP